jgi:hypothetical protein
MKKRGRRRKEGVLFHLPKKPETKPKKKGEKEEGKKKRKCIVAFVTL